MRNTTPVGRGPLITALAAVCLLVAGLVVATSSTATTAAPSNSATPADKPVKIGNAARATAQRGKKTTVVLVHGAFADASGWNDVSLQLRKQGYTVHAWANPLRGIASDGAYLRTFLSTIKGPVILVGHSYGGAVIGEASAGNAQVVALVYVAAYAPAPGETLEQATGLGGGHTDVVQNIVVTPYPGAPEGDGDAVIKASAFRGIFAQDLPRKLTSAMAAGQRPAALSTLVVPAGDTGWETIPSYFLIARDDHVIPPEAQSVMAARAGSARASFKSSHVLMMTKPERVVQFVLRADKEN